MADGEGAPLIEEHGGGDHGHPKAGGVQAGNPKKRRDTILILIGVVGLVLTIIIYPRSQSSSSAATTAPWSGRDSIRSNTPLISSLTG